jgi:hypothetical protein
MKLPDSGRNSSTGCRAFVDATKRSMRRLCHRAGTVGALQALRDFERVAYAKTAPGSAGVDWHRALRDIETLITRWSAGPVACVGGHKASKKVGPVDQEVFDTFLAQDLGRRRVPVTDNVTTPKEDDS